MNYIWVFVGGGLGSMLRYFVHITMSKYNFDFPWATLIANFLATIILGYFLALSLSGDVSELKKAMLMTGFCGGFSTFSTFSIENFQMFQQGQYGYAIANILASVGVCLLGAFIGYRLGS
jgi:CrcB protein